MRILQILVPYQTVVSLIMDALMVSLGPNLDVLHVNVQVSSVLSCSQDKVLQGCQARHEKRGFAELQVKNFMITLLSVGKVGGGWAEGHAAIEMSDSVV